MLAVDPLRSLEADDAAARPAATGPDTLPEAGSRPLWRVILGQFSSPLIYILFVAAVIAMAMGHREDAVLILSSDDNCITIVRAVEEGRLVYQNLRKVGLFLFTIRPEAAAGRPGLTFITREPQPEIPDKKWRMAPAALRMIPSVHP